MAFDEAHLSLHIRLTVYSNDAQTKLPHPLVSWALPHICRSSIYRQITSCPEGTEVASLDIAKAYLNSLILVNIRSMFQSCGETEFSYRRVAIEGLATAGGVQGMITDASLRVLEHYNDKPVVK